MRKLYLVVLFTCLAAAAQTDRVPDRINEARAVALTGHLHRFATAANDAGPADPSLAIEGMVLHLKPTAAQQNALDSLLDDLQNPASPGYHRWLTPDQFAGRFSASSVDYARVSSWLESKGFHVAQRSKGRAWLLFNGSAAQVRTAFRTEVRRFRVEGTMHYANSSDPYIPADLADVISSITGLDDFLPIADGRRTTAAPDGTSASGTHTLAPDDLATIYNTQPLYQAGIDGTGQRLAVVGQSRLLASDLTAFRTKYKLPVQDLTIVLVPGVTDPGITSSQDEGDLDVEWAGAVARKASVFYVYSRSAFTSLLYAVDQNIAPVITASYSFGCERQALSILASFRLAAQQAAAQGITWVNSSGDTGAAGCDSNSATIAQNGKYVHFPVSLPEVTGVGGTQFNEQGLKFWNNSNDLNLASAISYIPEMGWNESVALRGVVAGGGGISSVFPQPSWQTTGGVPANGYRNVPDVALSSADHDGYNVVSNGSAIIVFGTSAAAPVFAGMLALLNQSISAPQAGLGNVNPALYRLAKAMPSAFHDITDGSNIVPCVSGSPDCVDGTFGFQAGPGYDQVTGLGSPDLNVLITNWSAQAVPPQSIIALSFSQNPLYQHAPDSQGLQWSVTITLAEEGGVASTLTGFTSNGSTLSVSSFFSSTAIPANGSINTTIGYKTLAPPAPLTLGFTGLDANGNKWSVSFALPVLGLPAVPQISGVAHAASGGDVAAPGMLLSVYGAQLASGTQPAGAIPLITFMQGTTATINGVSAPLYYVSPGQLNIQVPYATAPGSARLIVTNNQQTSSISFNVASSAPGIFVNNGALTPISSGKRGDTVFMFITGEGSVTPALADGATPAANTAFSKLPRPVLPISMTIGGVDTPIVFAGVASGLVGVTQVNFTIPSSVPLGDQPVVVKVGDASSPPAKLTVLQ